MFKVELSLIQRANVISVSTNSAKVRRNFALGTSAKEVVEAVSVSLQRTGGGSHG